MNKYKNLISNTAIFAAATFGSKLLPFLLLPFYTGVLPPDAYGLQELITTACNLILPVMYLSMGEAVIRFGLDTAFRRRDVLTTGILTVLAGYCVLLCCYPLIKLIPEIGGHAWLIYLYILASATHTVISQFVRASGFVRLFAIGGIFNTLATVVSNIVLLLRFKMGAEGYVLSIVTADALSALLLFVTLKLWRFVRIRGLDARTAKAMLKYAVPLVPTAVFWWVTNLSDRFFVAFMCGEGANGVYGVSYKLPNLITLVSMIFTQAWQISAFTEYKGPEGEKFFSNIFRCYYTFVFIAASGLILICKPVMAVLAPKPEYASAWQYAPFLVLAVAFSTLVTFLGTIYNAVHKNGMVMFTTFVGAAVNIALNWVLIPLKGPWGGPQGAAIATFASFFVVFLIRIVDSRRYIKIKTQPWRLALCLGLLLVQIIISLTVPPFWPLWESLILLTLVLSGFGYVILLWRRLIPQLR